MTLSGHRARNCSVFPSGAQSQREKVTGRAFDRQIGSTKRGDRYADCRIRTGFAFDRHICYATADRKWSSGESRVNWAPVVLYSKGPNRAGAKGHIPVQGGGLRPLGSEATSGARRACASAVFCGTSWSWSRCCEVRPVFLLLKRLLRGEGTKDGEKSRVFHW